jgi:Ni,Fe-hydrogenase III small subunit
MSNGAHSNRQVHFRARLLRRFFQALLFRKPDYALRGNGEAARKRGRSMAIWVVDCGSNGADEREVLAMFNPVYDAEQYGFSLAASPRQADILLLSGPLTRNMEAALLAAFEAMPDQRRVVTVGDSFTGRGIFGDSYAVVPLPEEIAAACVAHVPGDPPSPAQILAALRNIS